MKLVNPEVRIETTNACNGRCTICPRSSLTRPITFMEYNHFRALVVQAKVLGATTISLFGYGEPLLDLGIANKIKHCNELNLKTFITTNASLLTVQLSHDILNAGLSKIRFSMHGRGKDYEEVHRGFSFVDTMRNIGNFLQINKTVFNNACTSAVSVIPMHKEEIKDIKDFWESKVDELEIWRPHNWIYGKGYREVVKAKRTCGRPHSGPIQIQADGKVVPCCFDYDGRLILGDIHEEWLEDIVRGEKYAKLRRQHDIGFLQDLPCEVCDQLNIEKESPLLYSSVDKSGEIGKTSSTKFKLKEI